jgi:hypothetical protein
MKIFVYFRKYMGKMVGAEAEIFAKLEPEPKFLTSRSRSRTKMDRLRNTAYNWLNVCWQDVRLTNIKLVNVMLVNCNVGDLPCW